MAIVSTTNLPMVIFLSIASVPCILFTGRSIRDCARKSELHNAMPAAPPALLSIALSELTWVLPCLIQCFLTRALQQSPLTRLAPTRPISCARLHRR